MTTRRSFIQGVLVAIGAAVMPKAAEAMPIDEPDIMVPHRKAALIDNIGLTIDMDEPLGYIGGMPIAATPVSDSTVTLIGPVPLSVIDVLMDSGITVLVSMPTVAGW